MHPAPGVLGIMLRIGVIRPWSGAAQPIGGDYVSGMRQLV
jgi:hypothetical protein